MEQITIPRKEYEKLKALALKVELIEEVIHPPELSEEAKKELAEARAVADSELIDQEEIKRRFGIE